MDLDKIYQDSDGNNCNILDLVRREPEWAANVIQYYEKALKVIEESEQDALAGQAEYEAAMEAQAMADYYQSFEPQW
jgi:hypothetical protein